MTSAQQTDASSVELHYQGELWQAMSLLIVSSYVMYAVNPLLNSSIKEKEGEGG